MDHFPYKLTGPSGDKATLGLVVLQVDETIEQDFRRLFAEPDVVLHVSRVPSGTVLTPDTIKQMAVDLPQAASLLPPSAQFDAIGYACTSGTTLNAVDRITQLVSDNSNTRSVSNPLSAAIAAFNTLDICSFGCVSPYISAVATPLECAFADAGFSIPATVSFGEKVEANVARIDSDSIRTAALKIGQTSGIEAVFLSCTNMKTLDIIDDLEQQLGLPVISSNQALAWHMSLIASAPLSQGAPGVICRK